MSNQKETERIKTGKMKGVLKEELKKIEKPEIERIKRKKN